MPAKGSGRAPARPLVLLDGDAGWSVGLGFHRQHADLWRLLEGGFDGVEWFGGRLLGRVESDPQFGRGLEYKLGHVCLPVPASLQSIEVNKRCVIGESCPIEGPFVKFQTVTLQCRCAPCDCLFGSALIAPKH